MEQKELMNLIKKYLELVNQKDEIEAEINAIKNTLIENKDELQNLYATDEFQQFIIENNITEVPIVVEQTKGNISKEVFKDIPEEVLILFAEKVWKPNLSKFRMAMAKHPELQNYYTEKVIKYIKLSNVKTAITKATQQKLENTSDPIDALINDL